MKPKANCVLMQPPIQDFYSTPLRLFPLGLLQIATPLTMEGYEVKILDCHQGFRRKIVKLPDDPSFWRLTLTCAGQKTDQITFLYLVRMMNFIKRKESHPLGLQLVKKFLETGKIYKALKKKTEYIFEEEPLNPNLLQLFLSGINS